MPAEGIQRRSPIFPRIKELVLSVSFVSAFFFPHRHRTLIQQFVRREILGRYRGSLLGVGWSFITPLLMLAVYTFVFVGVFKARWPGAEAGGGTEFALQIFAGLLVFNLFAEVANRAPRLILEQPNLVKKVVFPLETLPWISVLAAVFHLLLGCAVLLLAVGVIRGGLPPSALTLPLVLLPFLPLLLGFSWLFAALGVFVRDIGQMMGLVVNLGMFMSPIFYSSRSLAPEWQIWMHLNPLTLIVEQVRAVVLEGLWPNWLALGVYGLLTSAFAVLGALFFQATRKGFADVL